jgi:hypothetical protein
MTWTIGSGTESQVSSWTAEAQRVYARALPGLGVFDDSLDAGELERRRALDLPSIAVKGDQFRILYVTHASHPYTGGAQFSER